jgi:hypothetical protein
VSLEPSPRRNEALLVLPIAPAVGYPTAMPCTGGSRSRACPSTHARPAFPLPMACSAKAMPVKQEPEETQKKVGRTMG